VTQGVSRRRFLAGAAALGAGVGASALLAGCGGGDGSDGSLQVSNWTSYIDPGAVRRFERDTGIRVTYTEDINDNNEWFAKNRAVLARRGWIGRDSVVLDDWIANRLINRLDWAEPMRAERLPNRGNLLPELANPPHDPERRFSLPWQVGLTGIAYNRSITGREIRTFDEFLAVDGTTAVLTEMRDSVGLVMRATGADVTRPSAAAAEPAFTELERAVADGRIDAFTGNDYVNDLATGNLAAAFAWSGDVAQITRDNPDVRFVLPESGGLIWSDNHIIPKGARRPAAATEWIDWFYDPTNAARLTAYVQYISPVQGVAEELTRLGGAAARLVDDPLVVPTPDLLAEVAAFGILTEEDADTLDARFAALAGA
jgi:spermidine/putrescine transport system substrate-binding protein